MQPTLVAIAILAVWRLTYLLHAEDGPFEVFRRMRDRVGDGFLGRLFGCFYCLSMWAALPFAWWISGTSREFPVTWLALSGGAILVERLTSAREVVHLPYTEED